MKTLWRWLVLPGVLTVGSLALSASPASAQAFSLGFAGPGGAFGVSTYGGYPAVAAAPVIVAPTPVVVPAPVVVARPYLYGGYGRYYGGYYGGYRGPYHHGYGYGYRR
jgi:hypothetical protein